MYFLGKSLFNFTIGDKRIEELKNEFLTQQAQEWKKSGAGLRPLSALLLRHFELNDFEAKSGYNQPSVPAKSWLITGVGLVGKALNKVIYNYPISGTMSTRYKFIDNNAVYFTTSTVVGWTDIFTREMYKTILLDSVRHCQKSQGLKIHAQ